MNDSFLDTRRAHYNFRLVECEAPRTEHCARCGRDLTHAHHTSVEMITWDDGTTELYCRICMDILDAESVPAE